MGFLCKFTDLPTYGLTHYAMTKWLHSLKGDSSHKNGERDETKQLKDWCRSGRKDMKLSFNSMAIDSPTNCHYKLWFSDLLLIAKCWWAGMCARAVRSLRNKSCYMAGNVFPEACTLTGYFKVTWRLTMKLSPDKISKQGSMTDDHHYSDVKWISTFKISSCTANYVKTSPSGNYTNS